MKTVEELAKEYQEKAAPNCESSFVNDIHVVFIAGYQKAHEWIPFDENTKLKEDTYLCMFKNEDTGWNETKIRSWHGFWVDEDGEHDAFVTHFRYINL